MKVADAHGLGEGPGSFERQWLWISSLVLLALVGVLLVIWATPLGIGVGYDSYFYLTAAENLTRGHGLGRFNPNGGWEPLTHFPPLYPITLSLVQASPFSLSVSAAARYLSAALFGANSLTLALILFWATGSRIIGLIGGLLFLASPVMVEQHLWAMSEPIFFLLLLTAIFFLARYLTAGGSFAWIILASLAAGLAYLARYAALSVLATGSAVIISCRKKSWRTRLANLVGYFVGVTLIMAPWLLRNSTLTGSLTNRTFRFHLVSVMQLREAGNTVAGWLGPKTLPTELRLIILVLSMLPVAYLATKWIIENWRWGAKSLSAEDALLRVSLLMAVFYPGAVLASLTFFDASTRLRDRILSPLFLLLLIVTLMLLNRIWGRLGRRQRAAIVIFLTASFFLPYLVQSSTLLSTTRQQGLGFNSRSWRRSATVAAVRQLPMETLIYSNESFPVSYLTGRDVHSIPEKIDPVQATERPDYQLQLGTMRHRLEVESGYLVIFHPGQLRVEMPPLSEISKGLTLAMELDDGQIFIAESSHFENN